MTIGTTDTFTMNRDEIIADALVNVGALGPGKSATGPVRDHAARALERLVKSLDPEGAFLWRVTRTTLTTVATTAATALGTTVLEVEGDMDYVPATATTARSPIKRMTREQYMAMPDRTTAGKPTLYLIEKALSATGQENLTVTFWPVPDTSSDTIEFAALVRGKDFGTGAVNPDFPTSWHRCLVYGLSMELAPAYGRAESVQYYKPLFDEERGKLLMADNQHGGLTLVPFGRW